MSSAPIYIIDKICVNVQNKVGMPSQLYILSKIKSGRIGLIKHLRQPMQTSIDFRISFSILSSF